MESLDIRSSISLSNATHIALVIISNSNKVSHSWGGNMTIAFLLNDEFLKCHSSEYFVLCSFQTIVTDRIFL